MIDFEQARELVIKTAGQVKALPGERVALPQAVGRVLGAAIASPVLVPSFDYSAMDGYALCAEDVPQQGDRELPVRGESRTGHDEPVFERGSCVRIFTGAAIPKNADTVVMQENVTRRGEHALFATAPTRGSHIRRAGEDLQVGSDVLPAGARLSGFHLGLLASVEQTEVFVAARPHVSILCTGDELRPPGTSLGAGGLAESNGVALAALVEDAGGIAQRSAVVRDDLELMKEALTSAKRNSDVIITVGGVSVGDHDVVRPALEALGAEICFHKVKIKPGKPVLFARWGETLILGLPGNPSSAQVTFCLFGYPLLRALQGDNSPLPQERSAQLLESFRQKTGRRGFYRAHLQGDQVKIYPNQASGASTSMAWANSLVILLEEEAELRAGARVGVLSYNDL